MGLKGLFDSDQNLPLRENNARCSLDGNAAISDTDTSRTSTTSTRRPTIRRRRTLRLPCRSENWMATLQGVTGETRRQRLHLQHRSGKTHNGKRVGAHDIPHHLINDGEFDFLEGMPENRRVYIRKLLTRHVCAVQFVHNANSTINAHDSRIALSSFLSEKSVVIWCFTCLISLTVLSRAFLHEHFLFFTYLSHHATRTLNTSRTFRSSLGRQVAPSRITLA